MDLHINWDPEQTTLPCFAQWAPRRTHGRVTNSRGATTGWGRRRSVLLTSKLPSLKCWIWVLQNWMMCICEWFGSMYLSIRWNWRTGALSVNRTPPEAKPDFDEYYLILQQYWADWNSVRCVAGVSGAASAVGVCPVVTLYGQSSGGLYPHGRTWPCFYSSPPLVVRCVISR